MISSIGQSPTEPWFSDGGKRSRSDRAKRGHASCRRPRFGVTPQGPDRADHIPPVTFFVAPTGVAGHRPRHDLVPLLSMIWGVLSPGFGGCQ